MQALSLANAILKQWLWDVSLPQQVIFHIKSPFTHVLSVPTLYNCWQDCPEGSMDFRAEQCAVYNNEEFEGHYYE